MARHTKRRILDPAARSMLGIALLLFSTETGPTTSYAFSLGGLHNNNNNNNRNAVNSSHRQILQSSATTTTATMTSTTTNTSTSSSSSSQLHSSTALQTARKKSSSSSGGGGGGSPVVVSAKAEALSHSATTMKLIPSYEMFQLLPFSDGGVVPEPCLGNEFRNSLVDVDDTNSVQNVQIADLISGTFDITKLPDPFQMVEAELQPFSDSIKELVSTDQPILSMAAKHFFEKRHGKRFRPTIVQLLAKAAAAVPSPQDTPMSTSSTTTMQQHNQQQQQQQQQSWEWSGASPVDFSSAADHQGSEVWRRQAQLGQIVEMIHVASLIHDDVLDEADTRRGGEAVHKLYSNKVAVLAGDYLLARASVLLARLENTAVVQIMSTALESLVAGEIMQLKSPPESLLELETYLRKSYCKTASLICYACRSTALLGGHPYASTVATACEEFGFHLGLAYQIQDDILDFTAAATVLGKPALADMDLGLSTAPILYAAMEQPKLRPLIMRRFKEKKDKQVALETLYASPTAMDRAKNLAQFHAQRAVDALLRLPPTDARDALVRLTHAVITRKK